MKIWTETELKKAKIVVHIEYKMKGISKKSKPLIIKPVEMNKGDFDLLLNLFEEYGK